MYNVMNIQVPITIEQAEEVLHTFVKDYNGGFHPEDNGHEIVGPGGQMAFDKRNADHYNLIMGAVWYLLGDKIWDILMPEGLDD
jgi:hypothetical protein